jgi:carotenoid 1,2-hydratase
VAINVALYGRTRRWAMTERGRSTLTRDADSFSVGPSVLTWQGDTLVIDIDEVTVPLPSRLKGQIRFTPDVAQQQAFALDSTSRHHWWPYAPFGRISARFDRPGLSWQGHGYGDSNTGSAALEADFSSWTWSRASLPTGAAMLYEPQERVGGGKLIALTVAADGSLGSFEPPPQLSLKKGIWGVSRQTRSQDPAATRLIHAMEDAPFYTRSAIQTKLCGHVCPAVHESLDLDRFANPLVRLMLPFKMPRRAGKPG